MAAAAVIPSLSFKLFPPVTILSFLSVGGGGGSGGSLRDHARAPPVNAFLLFRYGHWMFVLDLVNCAKMRDVGGH